MTLVACTYGIAFTNWSEEQEWTVMEKEMKEHVWNSELNIGARRDQPDCKLVHWLRTNNRAWKIKKIEKSHRIPQKKMLNQLVFFDESSSEDVASLLLLSLLLSLVFSRLGTTAVEGSTWASRAAPMTCSGSSSYVFAWRLRVIADKQPKGEILTYTRNGRGVTAHGQCVVCLCADGPHFFPISFGETR